MAWIKPVTYDEASADAKKYIDERQGALKSEKCAVLLKNAVVCDSVEKTDGAWTTRYSAFWENGWEICSSMSSRWKINL